jgi:hypothetical protein
MLREVIEEIMKDYMFLRRISPKNELLKYFIVEGHSFRNNLDTEISDEFMERFRGDFPTLEKLKKKNVKINYTKYFSKLYLNIFLNYDYCLDGAIQFALMRN